MTYQSALSREQHYCLPCTNPLRYHNGRLMYGSLYEAECYCKEGDAKELCEQKPEAIFGEQNVSILIPAQWDFSAELYDAIRSLKLPGYAYPATDLFVIEPYASSAIRIVFPECTAEKEYGEQLNILKQDIKSAVLPIIDKCIIKEKK